MIYLDNAATSFYKPKCVIDGIINDLRFPANSGHSGHKLSIEKTIEIERTRRYLLSMLGAKDGYNLIFTKGCTDALNLAILGSIKQGDRVITSKNEHNAVLRPLYHLYKNGVIELTILDQDENGKIPLKSIKSAIKNGDILVFGGASNVLGAKLNLYEVGKIAKLNDARLIVDGAQCVPYLDVNIEEDNISMLACAAHKGLHSTQGVGFLIVRDDVSLKPLQFGGTGSFSHSLSPEIVMPESFEVGTQFSGGIIALKNGAMWSFDNIDNIRYTLKNSAEFIAKNLKDLGCKVYSNEYEVGIVSFNFKDADSNLIASKLNDKDIYIRAGLHCAPLVHEYLNTLSQGVARISVGCDTTKRDINIFMSTMEDIIKSIK